MANLFICHSQAQLLLAISLSTARFTQDENDLILFTDFRLKDELRENLDLAFAQVLYRTGTFPASNKTWKEKLKRYPDDLKVIRQFMDKSYDRVFEVCDECIPELFALKFANNLNPDCEFAWLEDGSYPYFRNTIDVSGFSTNQTTRLIRKIFLKYLLGLGRFYDFHGCYMGANHILQKAYLTFPGKQRKEYQSKDIVGISDNEFRKGLTVMYPPTKENVIPSDSVLVVMDKLDVYKDIEKVETTLKGVITKYRGSGKRIFYKYHPREESELNVLKDCEELSRFTGVENFYSANIGSNLIIVGIKSTGLQNAKKLGFEVVSLASIVDEADENVLQFYRSIGISILNK